MRVVKPPIKSSLWDEFFPAVSDTLPPDFVFPEQIAAEKNRPIHSVARRLRELVADGKAEAMYVRKSGRTRVAFKVIKSS